MCRDVFVVRYHTVSLPIIGYPCAFTSVDILHPNGDMSMFITTTAVFFTDAVRCNECNLTISWRITCNTTKAIMCRTLSNYLPTVMILQRAPHLLRIAMFVIINQPRFTQYQSCTVCAVSKKFIFKIRCMNEFVRVFGETFTGNLFNHIGGFGHTRMGATHCSGIGGTVVRWAAFRTVTQADTSAALSFGWRKT